MQLTLLLCVGVVLGADVRGCCGDRYLEDRLCTGDQDCMAGTFCDKQTQKCRGCLSDKECVDRSTMAPFCNSIADAGGKCEAACMKSDQCASRDASKPTCDNGACRGCKLDSECTLPEKSICDNQSCRGCSGNAECLAKKGPTTPICDRGKGTCQGCAKNADCADGMGKPGLCVAANGSLLDSGLAIGSCVTDNLVAYVDKQGCNVGTMDGSRAHPFCEITTALAGTARYVSVAPSTAGQPYAAVALSNKSVTLVGPWSDPVFSGSAMDWDQQPAATVASFTVSDTSTGVVDGFNVQGAMINGVLCNKSTASVTLRRSVVRGSSQEGIKAGPCSQLTIERSQLFGNLAGGAYIDASTNEYHIVNSVIASNSGAAGVTIAGGAGGASDATSVFEFNTVVDNGLLNTDGGGVNCQGGRMKRIANSIVVGNRMMTTQFGGSCMPVGVVTGALNMVDFVGSTYKLDKTARNMAAVIGQADKTATSPVVDYYGNPRPAAGRNKLTLGFHEPP